MSGDNWSLKGRKYTTLMDTTYQDGDHEHEMHEDMEVYIVDDIETLRQKLIEDLTKMKLRYDISPSEGIDRVSSFELAKMDAIDAILEIINKRFGAEE